MKGTLQSAVIENGRVKAVLMIEGGLDLATGATYQMARVLHSNGSAKPKRRRVRLGIKPVTGPIAAQVPGAWSDLSPKIKRRLRRLGNSTVKALVAKPKRKSGGRPTSEQRVAKYLLLNAGSTRADAIAALGVKNVTA